LKFLEILSEFGKYCNICLQAYPAKFEYCGKCGKDLQLLKGEKQCPKCGIVIRGKYCSEDGSPLEEIKSPG